TFGNATELIIALSAMRAGLHDVVKASIAGSIVGNILLVLGAAMFGGGLRHREQQYNATAARSQATLLTLAAIALILPAAYSAVVSARAPHGLQTLSLYISLVLLLVYGLFLLYSLVTHKNLFAGDPSVAHGPTGSTPWPVGKALLVLAVATALIAWISEILVAAIEPSARQLGLSNLFVGVFIVAILGNAAEHSSAISAAMKNRMDLALAIAIGSSVQVALFVAPVLVLASYLISSTPMDLAFSGGLVLSVLLAVLITGQVAGDGRSDWLKGVQLLAVYLILGLAYFFTPDVSLP
ncbi:MAG TPA: calcium/proton exchanger, partial [Pseudomonas sp.]|nr:calcium/proton exchanger [Pseudomonas sp.]